MIISERIFQLIKERGMTQKEFSNRTGIAQSTISDWKSKKVNPASDKIMVICDVLGVTPQELLTGSVDSRYSVDYIAVKKGSEDYEMLKSIQALPERSRERLFGYLEALKSL